MTILSKQTWKKLVRTHINPVSTFTSNEQEEVLGQAPLAKVFHGWFSGLLLERYFMAGFVVLWYSEMCRKGFCVCGWALYVLVISTFHADTVKSP